LIADSGTFTSCLGPLDAQCKLLEDMSNIEFECVDVTNVINIVEAITCVVHRHIFSQEKASCRSSTENNVSARSCFGNLFASLLSEANGNKSSGEASRDLLMCSLLKLVSKLLKLALPRRATDGAEPLRRGNSNIQDVDVSTVEYAIGRSGCTLASTATAAGGVDCSQTDINKRSHSGGGATNNVMTSTPNDLEDRSTVTDGNPERVTDGETDEQKTETAKTTSAGTSTMTSLFHQVGPPVMSMRRPRPCSHFKDTAHPEVTKTPSVAEVILSTRAIMLNLLESLGSCNSSAVAMILASSGLPGRAGLGATTSNTLVDSPVSVGDAIFQILCKLNEYTSDLKMIVRPLYDYLASELQGGGGGGGGSGPKVSRLSEPLLWFALKVLDCKTTLRIFLEMGQCRFTFLVD